MIKKINFVLLYMLKTLKCAHILIFFQGLSESIKKIWYCRFFFTFTCEMNEIVGIKDKIK